MTEDDRALLREWLETPHAREWWGDAEEELALIYDGKGEYEPFIDPDIRNERAGAAYIKAGFTPYDRFEAEDGTDLLMELLSEDFDYGSGYART